MRKVLIGVAALLVLLIAAIVAIPFFVPLDAIRDRIVAEVKSSTGRDLAIDGAVDLSVFPSVAVELGDVSLSNAPGASRPRMVTLGQLDVEVALLPLLSGEVVVKRLILREPVIALEIDQTGRPNWVFETADIRPPAVQAPAAEPGTGSDGGIGLSDLSLGEVGIVDGTVLYVDRRSTQSFEATSVGLEIALESLDSPLAIIGGLDFHGRTLRFELGADRPRDLVAGGQSSLTAAVSADALKLSFDGRIASEAAPELSGRLSLSIPSIADLADWLEIALSEGGLPVDSVALESSVVAGPAAMALETATLKIDDIEASGDLSIALGGRRPVLFGRLAVDRLDLDPLLGPEETAADADAEVGAPAAETGDGGWSDEPIDFSPLLLADADLRISSEGVGLRDMDVGPTVLTIGLTDGRLDFDMSRTSLFDGHVALQFGADAAAAVPAIRVGLQIDEVQAEPVLSGFADFDRLTGATTAEMAMTASGHSQRALVESLNGTGTVIFRDGTIRGINLAAMVRNLASAFGDPAAGESRATDFAELGASLQIVDGVARSEDIRLLSPLLRLEGTGRADLPPRTLFARLIPKLVADTEGQGGQVQQTGLSVPVIIEGPFDDLSYRPDLEGLVTGTPREQVDDIAETLRGGMDPAAAEDAVRGLLEGLTGGGGTQPDGSTDPADALRSLFGR